jgi:RNA polymerase sigma-70 factor, ECF subfamily
VLAVFLDLGLQTHLSTAVEGRMSSEAAYFPDALASTPEALGLGHSAPEIPPELCEETQSPTNARVRLAETIPQITGVSDELLLEQVQEGDKEALGILFRRHARAVRNASYRILRDEAEADDLVQDVFLFIFRKATLFDSTHWAARSWIIHVTYHRAFDRRRYLNSRHFYTSQELDDTAFRLADSREELPFHERSMEGILGKPLMARFNERLTPEQRETIRLYFFEGYALKEIAQLTGRSLFNVRSYYYRGLERMRKFVLPDKLRSK